MPPREWRLRVDDILDSIAAIDSYVGELTFDQFRADRKTVDAVVRNLEVIGEAARHLSDHQAELAITVPWADIAGMRNVLVHQYFGVDLAIIWQTIRDDLPRLRTELQSLPKPDTKAEQPPPDRE